VETLGQARLRDPVLGRKGQDLMDDRMKKYKITQDELINLVWIILFLIAVFIAIFSD